MSEAALPMGTGGYSSPQATVALGQGGTGGAFILGESKAAETYKDNIKSVLKDAARTRAAMNKAMADASDVPTTGAWDVDLPELSVEKSKIRDRAAQLLMKSAKDKKYANSKQYYEDMNGLNHMKDDLLMYTQASAQHKASYLKQLGEFTQAKDGKYEPSSIKNLADYKGNGGVKDIQRRMMLGETPMLKQTNPFDFYKTEVPAFQKRVGDQFKEEISGFIKTGKKNIMEENGKPTPFGQKVEGSIDSYLQSPDGQKSIAFFATDPATGLQRMPLDKATENVRQELKNSIDTQIKKTEYHPSVGKAEEVDVTKVKPVDVSYSDGTADKVIPTVGKTIPFNTKKDLKVGSNIVGVLDSETGEQIKDVPASATFKPQGNFMGIDPGIQIKAQGNTPSSAISNPKHYVRGEISYTNPKDEAVVLSDLQYKGVIPQKDGSREKVTVDNLTDDEKESLVAAENEQSKSRKKTVYLPFENVAALLPSKLADHLRSEFDTFKGGAQTAGDSKPLKSKSKSGKNIVSTDGGKTWQYE